MAAQPFNGLSPHLCVDGGAKAIAFYQKAFAAEVLMKNFLDNGQLMHASLNINGGLVMLCDDLWGGEGPWRAPTRANGVSTVVHIESADADKVWDRALAAGCTVDMPLEDQFWGQRYGKLKDPFGHIWSVGGPPRG